MKYLTLIPLLLLQSCSQGEKVEKTSAKEEKKTPAIQKQIIGRIASVSSTGNFVLIQKYGNGAMPKDSFFQSQGTEGRQASLKPSGERVRDFFAADLVSGSASIGDAVVAFSDPAPKSSPKPTDQQSSELPEKADVQENTENPGE